MPTSGAKRIVLVTNEALGLMRNGGAGTANTFLSFALAGLGHAVRILDTAPAEPSELDPVWAGEYERRGIDVRTLARPPERIAPTKLAVTHAVNAALEEDPPDVVVAHDWDGPAYVSMRLRSLGLGFTTTRFVVYCHGTNGWVYDAHRKVRRSPTSFELQALERASIELADVVVSPSAYLLDWMRSYGWRIDSSRVVPYFTRSAAEGSTLEPAQPNGRVRRLVFFGRLEERKGIGPFLDALNGFPPGRLAGLELLFVGKETPLWPVERIREGLHGAVKSELAALRFETGLDQPEAIALLRQPGTLAVMPSLVDNSPNVVYECLEHGIPFIASNAGGGPELVAAEQRPRAFVEPTAPGIRAGLERVLASPDEAEPLRASFGRHELLDAWRELIESEERRLPAAGANGGRVSAVVLGGRGGAPLERTLGSLAAQEVPPAEVLVVGGEKGAGSPVESPAGTPLRVVSVSPPTPADTIRAAVEESGGELVLLLACGDELEPGCVETLRRALASSGADAASCGIRRSLGRVEDVHLFLGEPGTIGLLGNYYGLVALYRRPALEDVELPETEGDRDWVLLATLSRAGARIVSVPAPLVRTSRGPGETATEPIGTGAALAVARAFQRDCAPELQELPRLAASLAAGRVDPAPASLPERLRWVWEHEGPSGLARRGAAKASRLVRQRG
jgi:glycosyltransferase involved in cell wall biosynthesis